MLIRGVVSSPVRGVVGSGFGDNGPEFVINADLFRSAAFTTPINAARAGTPTPVLVLGDSIAFGFGAGATSPKHRYSGLANRLATLFAADGVKSVAEGWLGNGLLHGTGTAIQYDDRIVVNTPYSQGINSLGGASMFANGAAASWTFTPLGDGDSIDLYYYAFGGGGTLSYSVDGGAATNVSTNGSAGLRKIAITGLSLGSHSLTVAWVSGQFYWFGADGFESSAAGFKFINCGINGGILSDFKADTSAFDPLKVARAAAPGLAFMVIGANHWNAARSLTEFNDDLQIIIDAFTSICPLVLISDPPSNPATRATIAAQQVFVDAMAAKAIANGLVMFDAWRKFGGSSADFAADFLADGIHPNPAGYQRMAEFVAGPFVAA